MWNLSERAMQAGFGDSLKLVGSLPETGEWDVAAAPEMRWCASGAPCVPARAEEC
jgi:hypothetical protein